MDPTLVLARLESRWRQVRSRRQPSQPITLSVMQELLADYQLALNQSSVPLASWGTTANMVLDTSIGKLVLKRYRATLELPQIVHSHSILTRLAQVGFPAPRLVPTAAGSTFVDRDGTAYALFHFVEGYVGYPNSFLPKRLARHSLSAAGEMLSRLHDALRDFVPEGRHPYAFQSLTGPRTRDLAWYEACLARCVDDSQRLGLVAERSGTVSTLVKCAPLLSSTLGELDRCLNDAAPPRLIIHQDYGPHNLLFRPGSPPFVLDFEGAHLDWRITDLARALRSFAWNSLGVSVDRMKYFMSGFERGSPVSDGEMQLIPAAWQYFSIRWAIDGWRIAIDARSAIGLSKNRRHLQWIDWVAKHGDEVLERLMACRKRS